MGVSTFTSLLCVWTWSTSIQGKGHHGMWIEGGVGRREDRRGNIETEQRPVYRNWERSSTSTCSHSLSDLIITSLRYFHTSWFILVQLLHTIHSFIVPQLFPAPVMSNTKDHSVRASWQRRKCSETQTAHFITVKGNKVLKVRVAFTQYNAAGNVILK